MSKIDEAEANLALASLQLMGRAYDDERIRYRAGLDDVTAVLETA